jgi:hypothetical protein
MVHPRVPTSVYFHYAQGFDTLTLAQMLDSLVRVSRRAADDHYASILANAVLGPGWPHCTRGYNTPRGEPHSPGLYPAAGTDAGPAAEDAPVRRQVEQPRPSLVVSASLSTISRTF